MILETLMSACLLMSLIHFCLIAATRRSVVMIICLAGGYHRVTCCPMSVAAVVAWPSSPWLWHRASQCIAGGGDQHQQPGQPGLSSRYWNLDLAPHSSIQQQFHLFRLSFGDFRCRENAQVGRITPGKIIVFSNISIEPKCVVLCDHHHDHNSQQRVCNFVGNFDRWSGVTR